MNKLWFSYRNATWLSTRGTTTSPKWRRRAIQSGPPKEFPYAVITVYRRFSSFTGYHFTCWTDVFEISSKIVLVTLAVSKTKTFILFSSTKWRDWKIRTCSDWILPVGCRYCRHIFVILVWNCSHRKYLQNEISFASVHICRRNKIATDEKRTS